MTVRYEANPPKVGPGTDAEAALAGFVERIKTVSEKCDAIHLTENVLGCERISPIRAGRAVRSVSDLPITVSMRVRDKDEKEIARFADECVSAGFSGILVLMGDPSQDGSPDSGQVPSAVVSGLARRGIGSKVDLYLSIPSSPDYARIGAKVRARPKGFMTQVVRDALQVRTLVENLRGFSVIPIILYPSEKNRRSAEFLGLELESYRQGFAEFVRDAHKIAGDVLITSPSDFAGVCEFLDTM
ncbi:MAG: 5,10-methenyltetrahydrofolate synthetase [Nitrosopumilus sp. H13]|nr:MAG: 5,10-methenyltetrahydrofolate synthetase [Nitrosopumilus sp. H13]